MASFITLQPDLHKNAGYSPLKSFQFAAEMSLVPILKDEVANAMAQMCLAFRKSIIGDEACFDLVALQSLTSDRNFFILPNGRWLRGYMPAFYRAQPFALKLGENSSELQLCIDSDAVIFEPADDDIKFFDDKSELASQIQKVLVFLVETLKNRQTTMNLCKQLDEAGLIVEWPISFSEPGENNQLQNKTLQGLYHIDAQALAGLSGDQLASLNQTGALSLVYGQQFSEARLKDLAQLQTAYRQMENNNDVKIQSIEMPDLDELFGEKEELFSF